MSSSMASCKMLCWEERDCDADAKCPNLSRWESCANRMSGMARLTMPPVSAAPPGAPSSSFEGFTVALAGSVLRTSSSPRRTSRPCRASTDSTRLFSSRYAFRPPGLPMNSQLDQASVPGGADWKAAKTARSRPTPAEPSRTTCRASTRMGTVSSSRASAGMLRSDTARGAHGDFWTRGSDCGSRARRGPRTPRRRGGGVSSGSGRKARPTEPRARGTRASPSPPPSPSCSELQAGSTGSSSERECWGDATGRRRGLRLRSTAAPPSTSDSESEGSSGRSSSARNLPGTYSATVAATAFSCGSFGGGSGAASGFLIHAHDSTSSSELSSPKSKLLGGSQHCTTGFALIRGNLPGAGALAPGTLPAASVKISATDGSSSSLQSTLSDSSS
mmetsp:Transcript_76543/g.234315  ORF Transcript_76543/g.234315 Transcript_76543/m.234315 type:complete len:389 (-) Transcript_76543:196-1362(-)